MLGVQLGWRSVRSLFVVVQVFTAIIATTSIAATPFSISNLNDTIVLSLGNGRFFRLQQERSFLGLATTYSWVETTSNEIERMVTGLGNYVYPKGEIRIDEPRKIAMVRNGQQGTWNEIARITDVEANYWILYPFVDGSGNAILRFDGEIGGADKPAYVFRLKSGAHGVLPVSFPDYYLRKLQSASSRGPNPYGSGLISLNSDGSLWIHELPPSSSIRNYKKFKDEKLEFISKCISPDGGVTGFAVAFGKVFVLKNGRLATLSAKGVLSEIPLPVGVIPTKELQVYSLFDFRRNEPVPTWDLGTSNASKLTSRATSLAVAKTSVEPNLVAGEKGADTAIAPADARPQHLEKVFNEAKRLKNEMRKRVIDQSRYTDALVDAWRDIQLTSDPKNQHRIIIVTGTTGSGKTFAATEFADLVLGDSKRVLEIDATHYAAHPGSLDHHRLLGASPGVMGQDKFKGILPEFLRGPGKERNVIIINEFEKADPYFSRVMMEMFDTGKLQSGDGKIDQLGQSIIIITSNKGSDKIYPRDRRGALTRAEIEERLSRFTDDYIKGLFLEPESNNMSDNKNRLDPAFLQRIDRAVPAAPPSYEGALEIAARTAERMQADFLKKNGLEIKLSAEVTKNIVDVFYVPEDGIRSVQKAIKRLFGDLTQVIHEKTKVGKKFEVTLDASDDSNPQLVIRSEKLRSGQGENIRIPASIRPDNVSAVFSNAEARKQLLSLEERLARHVFGQEQALRMTSRAIRARKLNPDLIYPTAMLYLGPTGIGKTETAKAVALEVFGDAERAVFFDMGNVRSDQDFYNIFNPPKGVVGSDSMSPFERFLNDFPEGGVIVFDEVGNMGRGEGSKGDLLMKFYRMLDEGRWTSSQGKTYDLRKYVFVFTSNEGQEYFRDLQNDDLRTAAWARVNQKHTLEEMLVRKYGWPEPLVGRFNGNLTLYKPATSQERFLISKKLVDKSISGLISKHRLKKLIVEDSFYQGFGDAFFSHTKGGRSIRGVANDALNDTIGQMIVEAYDHGGPKNATIQLSIKDTYAGLYSYRGVAPKPREVILTARLVVEQSNGVEAFQKEFVVDLTKDAAERVLSGPDDIRRTSYHEAGHAIVNEPESTREVLDFVTVKATGRYGGYARYRELSPLMTLTRAQVIARIGRLLGGRLGEIAMGLEGSSGWQNDLEEARKLAVDAVVKYGLSENVLEFPMSGGEVDTAHPLVKAEIDKLLKAGEEYAKKKLDENWLAYRQVAAALLKFGEIDGKTFDYIVELAKAPNYVIRFRNKRSDSLRACELALSEASKPTY